MCYVHCRISDISYKWDIFLCFWGPQTHGPTPPSATLGVLLPWQRYHKTPVVIRLMDWVNNIALTPPSATAHPTAPAAIGTCAQQLKIIFYSSVAALIILQYNLQLEPLCYSLRRIIVAFCVFLVVHVCTCCHKGAQELLVVDFDAKKRSTAWLYLCIYVWGTGRKWELVF